MMCKFTSTLLCFSRLNDLTFTFSVLFLALLLLLNELAHILYFNVIILLWVRVTKCLQLCIVYKYNEAYFYKAAKNHLKKILLIHPGLNTAVRRCVFDEKV